MKLPRPTLGRTVFALIALAQATCAGKSPPAAAVPQAEATRTMPGASWRRHVVAEGYFTWTAIAADFTGDGRVDVIAADPRAKRTILHVAPDWRPIELHQGAGQIHSEAFDVDGDGDTDYLAGQYEPGLVFWLERPAQPLTEPWTYREIDSKKAGGVDGVHGMIRGDLDGDGKLELIANSNKPRGNFPDSVVFYRLPADPRAGQPWPRTVFADRDAPGMNHYMGVGDLDGDGRAEIATGAKFGNYFAYWTPGPDPSRPWTKRPLPGEQVGATNILVADVNGDGRPDLVASRGHGQGLLWFEGPGFTAVHDIDPDLVAPHALAVGDIDGDGDVDVATTTTSSATVAWFANDGAGRFTRHVLANGQSAYDVRLVDMDGDGDLDLLVAGQESRNVVWFENPR